MESENNTVKEDTAYRREVMRISIATDFGWYELKRKLTLALNTVGYELADIDEYELVTGDDYPDFVVPLLITDIRGEGIQRAICGNGVEACDALNKVPGVYAAIITDSYSITNTKSVDDDMYIMCLGGQIKGYTLSRKKVMTFLNAERFTCIPSNQRIAKVKVLEKEMNT